MKKIILMFLLGILLIPNIIYTHPGRTDSNGGHYNKSTGEYHYHHGYPAHQHENGECPYDFNDNTNHSSSTGFIDKDKVYDLDEYRYYKSYDTDDKDTDDTDHISTEGKNEHPIINIITTVCSIFCGWWILGGLFEILRVVFNICKSIINYFKEKTTQWKNKHK